VTAGPGGRGAPAECGVLSLDAFSDWVAATLALPTPPAPEDPIARLTGGDAVRRLELGVAFDALVGPGGRPRAYLVAAPDVRALYLHYLEVCARPGPDP